MSITVPYTFSNATTADALEVNANFAAILAKAFDKTGDTVTGAFAATGSFNVGAATSVVLVSSQTAGDLVYASTSSAFVRLAKGTAYQVLMMNVGATAPAWTSTLGETGTRLTAGFFTDLTVTNTIVGHASLDELALGNPTVTGYVLSSTSGGVRSWVAASTPSAHQLDGAVHTVSGLTTGHFLKATGATTFAFGAHGLTYSDVGADASGAASTVQSNLNTHAGLTTTAHGLGASAFHADSFFAPAAGSASVVTLGTVTTGVWNAGAVTSSGVITAAAGNSYGVVIGAGVSSYGARLARFSDDVVYIGVPGATATQKFSVLSSAGSGLLEVTGAGVLTVNGFGPHAFSAGGTGANYLKLANTTAGTGNYARYEVGTDATGGNLNIYALSSTFTTAGVYTQAGSAITSEFAGGLSIAATHASGAIRFYTGGTTEYLRLGTAGDVGIAATNKIYLDGVAMSGNTYITEGAADTVSIYAGAVEIAQFTNQDAASVKALVVPSFDRGNSSMGPAIHIGRNTYAAAPAAGVLRMVEMNGTTHYIWVDASSQVRISTSPFTSATDSVIGTVVGTQTSLRSTKNILGPYTDNAGALDLMLRTPLWDFTYKSGAYNNQQFMGITTDDSPEFGMDLGKSFNPVSAHGYTIAAIKALHARIAVLEAAQS